MAQFGGDPANFPEKDDPNANPRRIDPETPAGRKVGEHDPPNTGGRSQSEAVRLARRGGSVAPPATDPAEKAALIPAPSEKAPVAGSAATTEVDEEGG